MAVSFDKVVEAYDSTRALSPDTMRQIVDTMQDVLRNCSTVLDVGVGTGRFACPLTERGFQVVGADISVPMMLKAREKGLSDAVRADARNLPFRNSAFDSVLLVEGLRKILTPTETRSVGEYSTEVKADAAIASLEKGDFAISWDLPKDVHTRIIETLRSRYAGKVFTRTDTFEIAVWKPEQLQRLGQVRV